MLSRWLGDAHKLCSPGTCCDKAHSWDCWSVLLPEVRYMRAHFHSYLTISVQVARKILLESTPDHVPSLFKTPQAPHLMRNKS